jgi:antitoxin Phd
VGDAQQGEPSIITRHGRPEAVIVSFEEWERLSRVPSFGRLLMAAPVDPVDLSDRNSTQMRDPDL